MSPLLVVFGGLPGTGKTSIARAGWEQLAADHGADLRFVHVSVAD